MEFTENELNTIYLALGSHIQSLDDCLDGAQEDEKEDLSKELQDAIALRMKLEL